jgi:U2-associated protein SR140
MLWSISLLVTPEDCSFRIFTCALFFAVVPSTLIFSRVSSRSGALYSVKIMWPRTPEEKMRNRHTGFVCFMNRRDAEDAMDACSEADPFNVGRPLMMRWGKNVKRTGQRPPLESDLAYRKKVPNIADTPARQVNNDNHIDRDTIVHESNIIRVIAPSDRQRAQFISTVASFVSKDGLAFEKNLIDRERNIVQFNFLRWQSNGDTIEKDEHIFYRWRVYSFCQGDGFYSWKTIPFRVYEPGGCHWIPPVIDPDAARFEMEHEREKEEAIERQKNQRRVQHGRRGFSTGRQLEQARRGGSDGGAVMAPEEMIDFNRLCRDNLCASREAICSAMAFCFEKSVAAKQISILLKDLLLDKGNAVSVETRIARMYLMSDILFNSQQPGVRNAFLYRDAVERMASEVFTFLGDYGNTIGRFSRTKLASAVKAVLGAWTNWGVYNPTFIDELDDRFEGKELVPESEYGANPIANEDDDKIEEVQMETTPAVRLNPQGDWVTVMEGENDETQGQSSRLTKQDTKQDKGECSDHTASDDNDADGVTLEECDNVDGEPVGDILPLKSDADNNEDGEPLGETFDHTDGAPLEGSDLDGSPLEDEVSHDVALESELDGEPL